MRYICYLKQKYDKITKKSLAIDKTFILKPVHIFVIDTGKNNQYVISVCFGHMLRKSLFNLN